MTDREAFKRLFNAMNDLISSMPVCFEDIITLDQDVVEQAWGGYYREIDRKEDE